jgi:predicted PurR-regulated permease PerM
MAKHEDKTSAPESPNTEYIDLALRFALLGILGYLSWAIISPFLTILLWSAILTVALYPIFEKLAQRLGRRWLAAGLITFLCLLVVIGPITWLGLELISGIKVFVSKVETGQLSIPLPSESIKDWPIFGERVYLSWSRAASNMKAELVELAPILQPFGDKLLDMTKSVMFGLVQFLLSIIIAGFLYSPGPQLLAALTLLMERILRPRGNEMVHLAGTTIRNVSRGVIGISLLQSSLGAVALLVAGIPGAGILAFASLVLGIVQIGPAILFLPIIIWSWTSMETASAIMFTAYMVPVSLVDNILKPILMARGLNTPMPVIIVGVIGGTLAYGIIGLFFGPIILSVAWVLIMSWLHEADENSATIGSH